MNMGRRAPYFVLCAGLVLATTLFGAPLGSALPVRWLIAGALLGVVVFAAWKAGLGLIGTRSAANDKALTAAALSYGDTV